MIDQLKTHRSKRWRQKQFVLSEDAMRQKQLAGLRSSSNKIENRKREIEGQLQVDRERA